MDDKPHDIPSLVAALPPMPEGYGRIVVMMGPEGYSVNVEGRADAFAIFGACGILRLTAEAMFTQAQMEAAAAQRGIAIARALPGDHLGPRGGRRQ